MNAIKSAQTALFEVIPEKDAKLIQFSNAMGMTIKEAVSYLFDKYNKGTDIKRYINRVLFFGA